MIKSFLPNLTLHISSLDPNPSKKQGGYFVILYPDPDTRRIELSAYPEIPTVLLYQWGKGIGTEAEKTAEAETAGVK